MSGCHASPPEEAYDSRYGRLDRGRQGAGAMLRKILRKSCTQTHTQDAAA
jgi:hypothetical protein